MKKIIALCICLALCALCLAGCRPVLKPKSVGSADSIKNRAHYMSEIEKLMAERGYSKTDRESGLFMHLGADDMAVYDLDDNALIIIGMSLVDGKEEEFFIYVLATTNELYDKSPLYLPLVAELIDIVSGYDISVEYLDSFCNGIRYDDDEGHYINKKYIDYHKYYELYYSITQGGNIVPDFYGTYSIFFYFTGLTKTGLA